MGESFLGAGLAPALSSSFANRIGALSLSCLPLEETRALGRKCPRGQRTGSADWVWDGALSQKTMKPLKAKPVKS